MSISTPRACPLLRQPLRVREAAANHEQGVAALDHVVAGLTAEQADGAGDVGQVVGQDLPAEQRLGDSGAEQFGDLLHLGLRVRRALADEHGDLVARVEDVGGLAQFVEVGQDPGPAPADAGEDGPVLPGRGGLGLLLLDVVGDDDRGDPAGGQRGLEGPVDDVPGLARVHDHLAVLGDVREQLVESDLLLVVGAQRQPLLLAHHRHDGLVVELGVVQAVEEVHGARPRRGDATAHLAGELGVTAGHERRHLLVPGLDELRVPVRAVEGAEQSVDPVTRIAVHPLDAPLGQALEHVVGDLGHGALPGVCRTTVGLWGYPPGRP